MQARPNAASAWIRRSGEVLCLEQYLSGAIAERSQKCCRYGWAAAKFLPTTDCWLGLPNSVVARGGIEPQTRGFSALKNRGPNPTEDD